MIDVNSANQKGQQSLRDYAQSLTKLRTLADAQKRFPVSMSLLAECGFTGKQMLQAAREMETVLFKGVKP